MNFKRAVRPLPLSSDEMEELRNKEAHFPSSMSMHEEKLQDIGDSQGSISRRSSRRSSSRRFSVVVPTEEMFKIKADEEALYVGAYGHIRKQYVDHAHFHSHYCKERQWLHDSIIEDYLENETVTTTPKVNCCDDDDNVQWLVLTVGVQGAGKHYTVRSLLDQHSCVLENYCCIDSDEIRQFLPEFDVYMKHEPRVVDSLIQKEAGYICETMCWAALQAGQSAIWDTSLLHPEWFVQHIRRVRALFPSLRVAVLHVTAPSPEIVQNRREMITEVTGRRLFGDLDFIQGEMDRIAENVEIIRQEADIFALICNSIDELELIEGRWNEILSAFIKSNPIAKPLPRLVSNESFKSSQGEQNDTLRELRRSLSQHQTSSSKCSAFNRRSFSAVSKSTSFSQYGAHRVKRFNSFQSTEENHKSDDMNFYGRFAHIRATLDYTYHKNYSFKRQRFQDSILQELLQGAIITDKDGVVCTTPQEPWIVFTAGPMGAGKSYTMHELVDRGRFPLLAFVNVDPDELRRLFPEYHIYAEESPELAGELTRKEAGYLAEILTLAALQAGKNVLVDGSLRDSTWYARYFARLRREFPLLRLAIIQVTAPKETVLARAEARGKSTGRVVPRSLLLEVYEQVPKSVQALQDLVDYHVTVNNPSDHQDVELVSEHETWESFQSNWAQTCAWVPRKLRKNSQKEKGTS